MDDFRRLIPFVRPHFPRLGFSLVLLVLAGAFEVLTTSLTIPLFDIVLKGSSAIPQKFAFLLRYLSVFPGNMLSRIALALLLLTLLKGLCLYHSNYLMGFVGYRVVTDLRNSMQGHVLSQALAFFSIHSTGRLMSHMGSDVDQLQEAVSNTLGELVREIVLLWFLIGWVVFIDWKLAAISLLIAPLSLLLTVTMGRQVRKITRRSREKVAELSDLLQQAISGIRIVKAFGMEQSENERFQEASHRLFLVNLRAARLLFMNSPIMEFLGVASFIPLLYYAQARIEAGTLTLGVFGGSLFALFRMYDPIRKLSRIHVQFQRAFASASRVFQLLDTRIEIDDRPGARDLPGVRASIEFDGVCFNYDDRARDASVLENITLSVSRGKIAALVGSSGAGKSTLVNLLSRFYEVSEGAIRIDGVDIRDITQRSLRRNIAIVTQDTFLFNDTIRANILYGDPDASEPRMRAAAEAALVHDFVVPLPLQYDTVIGERGQRLSGGERQRIAIARAILKDAPILILDEATSALDSESEIIVQHALANLMQERTTFVIAHRLSTVRRADVIVVLEDGRIRESGTHEQLLDQKGLYRRLFSLQGDQAFSAAE